MKNKKIIHYLRKYMSSAFFCDSLSSPYNDSVVLCPKGETYLKIITG